MNKGYDTDFQMPDVPAAKKRKIQQPPSDEELPARKAPAKSSSVVQAKKEPRIVA